MIFGVLQLLDIDAFAAVVYATALVTALIVGISFHEFSHAFVADNLGDSLPRRMGRVTLNPFAHLDPAGTILLFLVGFGWGKPVSVNPNATENPKATLTMTAAAGPLSNFLVAALAGLPLKLGLINLAVVPWTSPLETNRFRFLGEGGWELQEYIGVYLSGLVFFSLILGVFNLIPIAPLDGFKVAVGILPRDLSAAFAQLEQYGPFILLTLFLLPWFVGGPFIFYEVMKPIINPLAELFGGFEGDLFTA